jgi:hypothetical protein
MLEDSPRLRLKYGEVLGNENDQIRWCGLMEFVRKVSTRNKEIFKTLGDGKREVGLGDCTNKKGPKVTKADKPALGPRASILPFLETQNQTLHLMNEVQGVISSVGSIIFL